MRGVQVLCHFLCEQSLSPQSCRLGADIPKRGCGHDNVGGPAGVVERLNNH